MNKKVSFYYVSLLSILSLAIVILVKIVLPAPSQETNLQSHAALLTTGTEFGFQNAYQYGGFGTATQFQALHPQWIRFSYVVNKAVPALPSLPFTVKRIAIINQESVVASVPKPWDTLAVWKTYTDTAYIPALKNILNTSNFNALEIWNEEDLCSNNGTTPVCPNVPTAAYAHLIKTAAGVIKAKNPAIKVIIGGLASANPQYVTDVLAADPTAFAQVDAVGLHPYSQSPAGWCVSGCPNNMDRGDLATDVAAYHTAANLPVWVTEIGTDTTNQAWQAEYLQRTFSVLVGAGVPVINWYNLTEGEGHFGLVALDGSIKPAGYAFRSFSYPGTPTPTPKATPTSTMTPTPTLTPVPMSVQDTFQRTNQALWGTASDGNKWGGDANTLSVFSISGNAGKVANGSTNYNAILGPQAINAQVFFTGSMSSFSNTNIGAVLRWKDTNNWYKSYIEGANLIIQKKVNGTTTTIASTPFSATGGTAYSLRFQIVGTKLSARVWPSNTTEPTTWTATATDSTFTSGYCGLRASVAGTISASYTLFQASSL